MTWTWFPIAQVGDVLKDEVPDETLEVNLENIGVETVRFIRGVQIGLIFRNYLLYPNMNDRNPFTKGDAVGAMIFEDQYWIGINNEEA
jgi:hypothetical protein